MLAFQTFSDGDKDNFVTYKQKSRINKARTITKPLNGILWSNEIEKQGKMRIYKAMMSTLVYGAGTRRMKEQPKIEATQIGAL